MNALLRYPRALFKALRLTLRGEQRGPSPQTLLAEWMKRAVERTDTALVTAAAAGLDQEARRKHTLTIEGRRTNMDTILATVRFHASSEFPHLLLNLSQTNLTAIHATNVNDRFLVAKLCATLPSGPLKNAVEKIGAHLEAIPPIA